MGADTEIAWCDHTFNPWEGCEKVSPGCKNCYAEERDGRWHGGENWGPDSKRFLHTDSYWRQPVRWEREALEAGERRRVFCASLGDVMEDRRDLDPLRARLFALIATTPGLDYLLLTKRPQNVRRLWSAAALACGCKHFDLPNVWLGTTAEDQKHADERIPHLLAVPAAVHFLSAEPLLGPLDLSRYVFNRRAAVSSAMHGPSALNADQADAAILPALDWVIVGGESGHHARPFDVRWARSILEQCGTAGVACFVKQLGARPGYHLHTEAGRGMQFSDGGKTYLVKHKKGGDPAEWPADLRVRQFPEARP